MGNESRGRQRLRAVARGPDPSPAYNSQHGSNEDLYRDLFENATDIVFTTDLSGHFLAGNRAVQRLLGYTVAEARKLTWEKLVPQYDLNKATQMFRRHARGELQISFELDAITKSGAVRTFEIGSRPLFQEGRLAGFHGIARDITERKQLQEELESARRSAEQASRAKSTFLANMSHEIRTPINGILGFVALMGKTPLSAQQQEYLEPVAQSAQHLLNIVNDILDLSKIEAGQFSIHNEVTQLHALVRRSVGLLKPLAEQKGLDLVLEVGPDVPCQVVGDATRVGQIIGNLVNNAIKFTDSGNVTVCLSTSTRDAVSAWIKVCVRDTGIGISGAELERLFAPFQQVDNATTRRYGGTGLGLTITRTLVRAMGGDISIRSEPGVFTEVTVNLPMGLISGCENGRGEGGLQSSFRGAGLRALIVDDNEINQRFLKALLRQYELECDAVDGGRAAIEACRRARYDLVLMDIHMAGLDGIETTQRLRGLDNATDTPIIAVSADIMGDQDRRCRAAGMDGFVAKPVEERDLLVLLARHFPERCAAAPPQGRLKNSDVAVPALDAGLGIRLAAGNKALWLTSVERLAGDLPEQIADVKSALERRDYPHLQAVAHRLAGSAAYVAAPHLKAAAMALEKASNAGDLGASDRALEELMSCAGSFIEAAQESATPC